MCFKFILLVQNLPWKSLTSVSPEHSRSAWCSLKIWSYHSKRYYIIHAFPNVFPLTEERIGSLNLSDGTASQDISIAPESPGEHGVSKSCTISFGLLGHGPLTLKNYWSCYCFSLVDLLVWNVSHLGLCERAASVHLWPPLKYHVQSSLRFSSQALCNPPRSYYLGCHQCGVWTYPYGHLCPAMEYKYVSRNILTIKCLINFIRIHLYICLFRLTW